MTGQIWPRGSGQVLDTCPSCQTAAVLQFLLDFPWLGEGGEGSSKCHVMDESSSLVFPQKLCYLLSRIQQVKQHNIMIH